MDQTKLNSPISLLITEHHIKSEIKEENYDEDFDGQHLISASIDILDVHEENANQLCSKEIKAEHNLEFSFDLGGFEGFNGFHLSEKVADKAPIEKRLLEDDKRKTSLLPIKYFESETTLEGLVKKIKILKSQYYSFLRETSTINKDILFDRQFCKKEIFLNKKCGSYQSHSRYSSYQCSTCGALFVRKSDLEAHKLMHLKITLFRCSLCSRVFKRRYFLNQHKKSHFEPIIPFICSICGKSFKAKSVLKTHLLFHSNERIFGCDVCGKAYPTRQQLRSHSVVHSPDTPFSCADCGMRFKRKLSLVSHVRTHLDYHPFSCIKCNKSFKLESGLRKHKLTHFKSENTFICSICKKTLKTKQTLIIHHRQHSGTKPFKCSRCGKCFRQLPHLRTHERSIHASLKLYSCTIPFCERSFNQRSHLTSHLNAHFKVRPHKCPCCGKGCSTKAHLRCHQRIHSGEKPFGCHNCEQAFNQRSSLITHIRANRCAKN